MSTPKAVDFEDYDSNNQPRPVRREAAPQMPLRSAALLTWGVALLLVGPAVGLIGLNNLEGDPAEMAGALMSLVGLILLLVGVYRLAANVDISAQVALDGVAAASAARSGVS